MEQMGKTSQTWDNVECGSGEWTMNIIYKTHTCASIKRH